VRANYPVQGRLIFADPGEFSLLRSVLI